MVVDSANGSTPGIGMREMQVAIPDGFRSWVFVDCAVVIKSGRNDDLTHQD